MGGGNFLKNLITAENLEGQQSRDHTIRQDARVVEYDFWWGISHEKCKRAGIKCLPSIIVFASACNSLLDLKN